MIRNFSMCLFFLVSLHSFAQSGTASPYSYYGIGDVKFKGTIENRSMGGISVFPDSIHVNLQNPAHLAGLQLTNYSLGATMSDSKAKTETGEDRTRRTALDYFAVGMPLKKMGISFGAIPYSSVGYKIHDITQNKNYDGTGGVNKVFLGMGRQLGKNFAVGFDFQYNFGIIKTSTLGDIGVQYETKENNISNINGYNFDFGITYKAKLNAKLSLFSSLTYTPQSELQLNNTRNIQLVQLLNNGSLQVVDSYDESAKNSTIKTPSKLGFGTGFGQPKKWLIGGEITFIKNSVLSNRFTDITGATFENTIRYNLGGYYIPNYSSYTDYYKKIVYRGGFRYENTGLILNNSAIKDYAATFGIGLPITGTFSNINIGAEIGKRGTKQNGLIEENYVNISIGFSLNDKWFVKRKFD